MDSTPLRSPYKFLDSYGQADRDLFFGRERETRVFLSDIVVARLVVLFAKTGTGKTSLINAGVRPLLEEREYATFLVRVAEDPLESARAEVRRRLGPEALADDSFAAQLTRVARDLERSVVVFFDQFEEFFLQTMVTDPDRAQQFISDVADLYEDEHSHVHVVFSMREEFFVEMDAFRDDIPTIFHNDSNLRLRWFDEAQAREAITKPAAARGVEVEETLVDHLLADLRRNGTVEPAQLQILCDTLWRRWAEGLPPGRDARLRITDRDYAALATDAGPNVAKQILSRRLEQEFEKLETREELELLGRLLPLLRTERNTKYPRDTTSLVTLAQGDPDELEALLRRLEDVHLIRRSLFENAVFVELSHDYLAEQLEALRGDIEAIWPRRVLARALAEGSLLDRESVGIVLLRRDPPLELDAREADLVLRSALATNADTVRASELAREAGADVRAILEQALARPDSEQALAAVRACGTPGSDELVDLAERALREPRLSFAAMDALVDVGSEAAVAVLVKALGEQALEAYARSALESVISLHGDDPVGHAAKRALDTRPRASDDRPVPDQSARRHIEPGASRRNPPDDRHYSLVAHQLLKGAVIPFLGPDVNVSARSAESSWQSGQSLPSSAELAGMLAERSRYPGDDTDLLRVSQYVDVVLGEGQLYRYLHAVFDADYPTSRLHRLLAGIPRLLRERGRPQLVLLTTNYDDLVERALDEAGEAYDVVWYEAKRGSAHGSFLHRRPSGDVNAIEFPNKYTALAPDERPVVVKLLGSVDRGDRMGDSFVVTEDAFIDYLIAVDGADRLLPFTLLHRMAESHFLFLGLSVSTWHERGLINRLWASRRLALKSWSVRNEPHAAEAELWPDWDVDVLDADLDDYTDRLQSELGHAALQ